MLPRDFLKSLILVLLASFSASPANAQAAEGVEDYAPYGVLDDALGATETVIDRAAVQGKLALIVIGANWCHDSKALARRLEQPAIQDVLEDHYEVLVVGAGHYEHGFDVAERLGIEIYTHTPTVLIYDPQSQALVNIDDHHIWRDAYRLSDTETLEYFEKKTDPDNWATLLDPSLHPGLSAFEKRQAERLLTAYALLGPMLKERAEDLDSYWNPVRDFRYQFTDDLNRLRDQARDAAASGEAFEPDWPEYEPFPWEKSAG